MNFLRALKNKFFVIMAFGLGAINAMAADELTFDAATGSFTGKLNVTPFMSGVAILIAALGAFWAVKKVIGLFR